MKVIDLLNKIANGEELAPKIKFHNMIWVLESALDYCEDYYSKDLDKYLFYNKWALTHNLNDEVEIIEDKQEPKPITKKDLEAIGYAFCEMKKALQNGWDKSLKNEPFKEDKKIDYLTNEEITLYADEEPVETIVNFDNKELVNKINEIIDEANKLKDDRK